MPYGLSPHYESVTGMGDVKMVYKQPWHFFVFRTLPAWIPLALGVMVLKNMFSGAFSSGTQVVTNGFIAILLFGIGFFRIWKVMSDMSESAVVYEYGFAHLKTKNLKTIFWSEISAIWTQDQRDKPLRLGPYGVYINYVIELRDGQKHALTTSLYEATSLMETVRRKMIEILAPKCKMDYDSGQGIDFGPIHISKSEGIQVDKMHLTWDLITSIDISKATLSIRNQKGLFTDVRIPIADIPNIDVFLDLIYKIWYADTKQKD